MSGIMHKIGDALHIGGDKKEEDKHKGEAHHDAAHGHGHGGAEHKGDADHGHGKGEQHKEGLIDKIKDKIHGDGTAAAVIVIRSSIIIVSVHRAWEWNKREGLSKYLYFIFFMI
ncbi:hypothetical protein V6N13_031420 [Hibiscus sabdariffa]|uniref:Uncharacterized protein n=1 Tax=Hibiscus sabdariffa TaxID=183260 RepID=A0ABR2CMM1_9ROSI